MHNSCLHRVLAKQSLGVRKSIRVHVSPVYVHKTWCAKILKARVIVKETTREVTGKYALWDRNERGFRLFKFAEKSFTNCMIESLTGSVKIFIGFSVSQIFTSCLLKSHHAIDPVLLWSDNVLIYALSSAGLMPFSSFLFLF